MTGLFIGVLLILGGIAWGVLGVMAAGMASRQTTKWENYGPVICGSGLMLVGVVFMVWG